MKYRRAVAYIPDTSVLFELEDGGFALVATEDDGQKFLITVSGYAESFLKFGGFSDADSIPEDTLNEAARILGRGERIFICKDIELKGDKK